MVHVSTGAFGTQGIEDHPALEPADAKGRVAPVDAHGHIEHIGSAVGEGQVGEGQVAVEQAGFEPSGHPQVDHWAVQSVDPHRAVCVEVVGREGKAVHGQAVVGAGV